LVRDSGVLDVNSVYAYLLICRDFAETSVVVRSGGDLAGMITGYIPPARPDTLFIWQVAVRDSMRGRGIAGRMLDHLLERKAATIRFLETTVSPSNSASERMFAKLARRYGVPIEAAEGFPESLFPEGSHEAEPRLVLGPFQLGNQNERGAK